MNQDDLNTYIKGLITQLKVTSVEEMGKIMGLANKELSGKADGKAISETIKRLLS